MKTSDEIFTNCYEHHEFGYKDTSLMDKKWYSEEEYNELIKLSLRKLKSFKMLFELNTYESVAIGLIMESLNNKLIGDKE